MENYRVSCPVDGHESDWIELNPTGWTMGDTRRLDNEKNGDAIFATVISRMTSCHLTTVNGDVVTSVKSPEDLDNVEEEIYGWFPFALYEMIGAKRKLGNLSALASFGTKGKQTTPTQSQEPETSN